MTFTVHFPHTSPKEGISDFDAAMETVDAWCGIQWRVGIAATRAMSEDGVNQIGFRCMDDRFVYIREDGTDGKYVDIESEMA